MVYDVIVIGAGVTGAFIARSLSRFQASVCLVEKSIDVAAGASKANSAIIHAGYDAEPGTLKARLNVQGSLMMEQVCRDLDVPFKRIGSLVIVFTEEDKQKLAVLLERGLKNGVDGLEVIDGGRIREIAPNVTERALYALHAKTAGIVCPYELTAAAVENALENGVEFKRNCEVLKIQYEDDNFIVSTSCGVLKCRYIVNAAGLYADLVSAMAGDAGFSIKPRKGEYMLFDKSQGEVVNKVIFQLPTERGKGILVTPTVDGNLLIGPNAEETDDREDTSTSAEGLEYVRREALKAVPCINVREVITSFAGLRATATTKDFIIAPSSVNARFINASGIDSPGLTSAPAIGEYVTGLLKLQGLLLQEKTDFNPVRKPVVRFRELGENEMNEIIKKDPRYGRIVCRCERITEGEVADCIRRPAGARDIDAVKRRTRAGMGRCQGGFCTPRIVEILSRETGIPVSEITKAGGKSRLLFDKPE